MSGSRRSSSGYGLIEMLVAIVVGLILMAGLIQVTASQKMAYRLQRSVNVLDENGRFAVQFLDRSLRLADHWGGIQADMISGDPPTSGPGSCGRAWINNFEEAIRAWDGEATAPLGCVDPATDYEPNTDMLAVRYADPEIILAPQTGTVYLRTSLGRHGILFEGSEGVPASLPDADGTYTFPYQTELYFVRRCSIPGGGDDPTACDPNDDDGNPIPTLVRLRLDDNGALQQQPLVEGVEDLQIRFGLDQDMDTIPEIYLDPTALTDDQWADVVTAELNILVRGFAKGDTPGKALDYPAKNFNHVVQLRNRSRS